MRIAIDIPDELLEEAQRVGIFETPQEAVVGSVEYLVTSGESHQFTERMGPYNSDFLRETLGESLDDDDTCAARADEIRAKLGTYRIDMTREELLRWRKMGCGHELPENEHGGESGADDSRTT